MLQMSCIPFSSLSLGSGLYFFRPQSPRKNAHSLLKYFGIRGICITSLPAALFCRFVFGNRKTPNISRKCSLSGRFWTFLLDMRGFTTVGNITLSLMVGKPAICCFVAIEKRHIAAALLLCPEDGARGLFSYLLCFFLLATTAVPMAALPLTSIRTTSKAGLLVSPVCGMVY